MTEELLKELRDVTKLACARMQKLRMHRRALREKLQDVEYKLSLSLTRDEREQLRKEVREAIAAFGGD